MGCGASGARQPRLANRPVDAQHGLSSSAYEQTVAGGHPIDPVAEAVTEHVRVDRKRRIVTTGGGDTSPSERWSWGTRTPGLALPARRSSQLSYSPVECEVVCKVNACPLSVASRRSGEGKTVVLFASRRGGQQEAAIKFPAIDGE